MKNQRYINADDYRVPAEKFALYLSMAAAYIILFLLIGLTFGWFLVIVLVIAMWVRIQQGQLLGQCVKVSEHQLPEVYKACKVASERLSMRMPDIFVRQDPVINAYAIGFLRKRSVVLHSATVESMNEDELIAIIGHEFSHIKCNHTTWMVLTCSAQSV